MLDIKRLVDKLKTFNLFASITNRQISGIVDICNAFYEQGLTDIRQLAFILATVCHETGKNMQPTKEWGGEKYLKSKKYYPYYGRDLVQTTWLSNYQKVKMFSGIDVVAKPELIGQMPLAAKVAVVFMQKGWYTGKKLGHYINQKKCNYVEARRIINGLDKAELVAGYAEKFEDLLKSV